MCTSGQLSPSKALSTHVVSAAWARVRLAPTSCMTPVDPHSPQPQERLSWDFHLYGGGDSQDSGGMRSADSRAEHRAPRPGLLPPSPHCPPPPPLPQDIAHKRRSIIALRILECKRSKSDVWAQKSPPEGDACFSASSTQGLLQETKAKAKIDAPDCSFFRPGNSRHQRDKRWKQAGPLGSRKRA